MPTFDADFLSLDRQTTKGRAILALRDCVDALVAGGGDDLGNHTATQALDMAGFNVDSVVLINGQNSANGVDAPNVVIQGGSPAGSSTADGAEVQIIGGDSQDLGSAGDIIIRGGLGDRTAGGAILINAGAIANGTSATGGVVTISSGTGGATGPSGSVNLSTPTPLGGSANAGKVSLRPGAGGVSGGDGGLVEFLCGNGQGGGAGGALQGTAGRGTFNGTGDGGEVIFKSGETFTGTSGNFTIQIGVVNTDGSGGTLELLGADGEGATGNGSVINITAGSANGAGDGGSVNLTPGNVVSGTHGVVNINDGNGVTVGRFDENTTAGETRFLLYDVDNGTLERVTVGAADSGGAGFKVLRIPN